MVYYPVFPFRTKSLVTGKGSSLDVALRQRFISHKSCHLPRDCLHTVTDQAGEWRRSFFVLKKSHPSSRDPSTDCSLPGFSVHGVFQAKILEWVATSSSRGSSWPKDWSRVSCSSCTDRQICYYCATMSKWLSISRLHKLWTPTTLYIM